MSNQIKYYSLNSLDGITAEKGSIYFLSNGSQFIGTSSNTFLPISDFIFTDTMPQFGIMDKIYVHKEVDKTSLKIWGGNSFELLSGSEYDDSTIQQVISTLQSELSTVQGKITTVESKVTTDEGKISTLETKVEELENKEVDLSPLQDEIDSLATKTNDIESDISTLQTEISTKGNVKSVNGNVADENGNVTITIDTITPYDDTELRGKVTVNEGKISTLETKVTDLEAIPPVDLSPLETQINNIETELSNLDGKVKLNGADNSTYLDSKLDNDTLKVVNNKLVAMKLNGQLSTIAELNFLTGATSNIQSQINNLSSVVDVKDEIVDTEGDLPTEVDDAGTIILVRSDSTQDNSPTFYRSNGTSWVYVNKINNEIARNFATQPIDLASEVTGILPKSNYEGQSASDITVTDSNGNFTSTNVEGVLEELNSKISDLENVEVEVDLSPIQSQIDDVNGEITTVKSNVSTNATDIATLNGKVSTIESNIETLETTINNLPIPQEILLNDTVTSTSTTEASTARAVKEAYDKGVEALNKANEPVDITVTKSDVGLGNVDNVKQMPISGGILENYTEKLTSLSSGEIDLSLGNVFTHILTVNTTYSIANAITNTAHSFTLIITQGTTARTITFPSSIKWQTVPDISAVSKTYILSFVTVNGGATWYGVLGGAY